MREKQKYTLERVIHPTDLRSTRRLLARYIVEYQKGNVKGSVFRDLVPALRLLSEIDEKLEIIIRIEAIEKKPSP